jgi:membrane protein implicated in regulation of membrane protease activity
VNKPFTIIAIVLFSLIALLQLLRFILGWEATVNGVTVPLWVSGVAFVLAVALALMLWRETRKSPRPESEKPGTPDQVFETELRKLALDEAAKLRATTVASDGQKALDRLFDYTKFHIGLYLTLTTAYVAVASIKKDDGKALLFSIEPTLFWLAVFCFILAGVAGGVIASSITQTRARSTDAFLSEAIGPWALKVLSARSCTWIEHTSFWLGLICALLSVRQ